MSDALTKELADGVLTLTLNKPEKLNALDAALAKQLYEQLKAADNDSAVRVVVLTAAGRGFSAGADLARDKGEESGSDDLVGEGSLLSYANQTVTLISQMSKPVIGAVNGIAAGVGVSYALACDIVIARESASFLLAFSRIGLMPDGGATLWVAASVGRARAMEMALMAEKISASEAKEWGMISRVVADDDFESEVSALAKKLAAGPTRAYAKTKAAINASSISLLSAALERESKGQAELLKSKDNAEGVAAFLEKREAKFTGD
ncbi:enoyl-CoA hydratase [Blastococcus sp. Marseille-P5729]|uniref:enoyl-CoA hydratase n=1 Tax=Blastococcus sp. Marseille-P5729 TaxID=2086582 RepID=UPI0018FF0623|nr:enoyl-CoA hydratase [Blastococcus sp. Marseille-P5729]